MSLQVSATNSQCGDASPYELVIISVGGLLTLGLGCFWRPMHRHDLRLDRLIPQIARSSVKANLSVYLGGHCAQIFRPVRGSVADNM
jgi:hypothetical protein